MSITRFFFFVLLAASSAFGQIGIGIKAGLPLSDTLELTDSSNRTFDSFRQKRYLVGPQIELRLPAGFAIELDALYSNFSIDTVGSAAGSVFGAAFDGNSWEFPLMLKKKFGGASAGVAAVRPFVGAGASFRRLGDLTEIGDFITGSSDDTKSFTTGFVVGAGVEIRALFLRISPEVRWTRWGTDNFREGLSNILKTNKNQGQFLVGFSF